MVLRATTRLAKRLKIQSLAKNDGRVSAFDEWFSHLFIANRFQYVLFTNAYSLYSCVFPAKGITSLSTFADLSGYWLTNTMRYDGCDEFISRFVMRSYDTIDVYATNNRGVLGSMNDMIYHAKSYISEHQLPLLEVSLRLNIMVYGYLKYKSPIQVLTQMSLS